MREVNSVIEAPNVHGRLDLAQRWRLARQLRSAGYHRAIVLPNSAKSALVPWLAGIARRIGYRGEARRLLLNQVHEDRRQPAALIGPDGAPADTARSGNRPPMVEHYAALAFAPGQAIDQAIPDPKLQLDPGLQWLARERLGLAADAPIYALCPGAEYGPAKRWPVKHFARLAGLLRASRPEAQVLILGGPKDRPVGDAIQAAAEVAVRNLCGETTLTEAMALLAGAAGVASNDSGLMHVTAAFDRPLVAMFGSSDPRHTPPRSRHARVEWLQLECSPCFERKCPLGHLACLEGIAAERVASRLQEAARETC
jgi:heptosyltransferase-2